MWGRDDNRRMPETVSAAPGRAAAQVLDRLGLSRRLCKLGRVLRAGAIGYRHTVLQKS